MKLNKKIIGLAGTVLLSTAIVGGLQFNKSDATTEPPIYTEVRHQGEVLDNHEDRITNTEKDVTELQTKTGTPPSPTRTIVREVSTPSPPTPISSIPITTPTPQSTPVTVVSYEQIAIQGSEDVDCKYTYSDDTSYQWRWKTVAYDQGSKIISTHGQICDIGSIGQKK